MTIKTSFSILFSIGLLICCAEKMEKADARTLVLIDSLLIPNTQVNQVDLDYDRRTSIWTLNDQLFSGYAVLFYEDSILREKIGILNGRKQNQSMHWYPDGHLQQVSNYHQGKLHGEKKLWSPEPDHILIAHLKYHTGKAHGEQKKWYASGELFKKLHLNMGREEGIQQAFRKNGALYANYEAKEGRIFGLKKAQLCFGLEDENVQYEN